MTVRDERPVLIRPYKRIWQTWTVTHIICVWKKNESVQNSDYMYVYIRMYT